MTIYEVVLRVNYEGINCSLTTRFPSLKMFFWCNREHDVIEVIVRDPEEYSLFIKETPRPDGLIGETSEGQPFHLITRACSCMKAEMSVIKAIADLDILYVSPGMAENGWEYHRIVVFKHEDLADIIQRLEEAEFVVEILRKVPFDGFIAGSLTLNADALFSNLTEKQISALLIAHRFGYFKLPRRADVQTIAAKKRVPRTTFSDNLRKAENKLIAALVPYILLFNQASNKKKASLKMK